MSIEYLNAAFNADIKPALKKFVLVALCAYVGGDGEAQLSIDALCRKTGQNRKTVIKHISGLADDGILTINNDTGNCSINIDCIC